MFRVARLAAEIHLYGYIFTSPYGEAVALLDVLLGRSQRPASSGYPMRETRPSMRCGVADGSS